jgi:hypothetical protein
MPPLTVAAVKNATPASKSSKLFDGGGRYLEVWRRQVVLMLLIFSAYSRTRFLRLISRCASVMKIRSVILCHHHDRAYDWICNFTRAVAAQTV